MVTHLLAQGYSASTVGLVRMVAVAFEIAATWIVPQLMSSIGSIRAGLWSLNWQVMTLAVGLAFFWAFMDRPVVSASALVAGTILSRLGLRGFDLCAQIIVQEVRKVVLTLQFHC